MQHKKLLLLFILAISIITYAVGQDTIRYTCDTNQHSFLKRVESNAQRIKNKKPAFYIHYQLSGEDEVFSYITYIQNGLLKDRLFTLDYYLQKGFIYTDSCNVNLSNFDTSILKIDTILTILKEISEIRFKKGFYMSHDNHEYFEILWHNTVHKFHLCSTQISLYNKRPSYDLFLKWTNSIFHKCGDIRMCKTCRTKKIKAHVPKPVKKKGKTT